MDRRLRSRKTWETRGRGRPEPYDCVSSPRIRCCPLMNLPSVPPARPTALSQKRLHACFFLRIATPLPKGQSPYQFTRPTWLVCYARSDSLLNDSSYCCCALVTRFE